MFLFSTRSAACRRLFVASAAAALCAVAPSATAETFTLNFEGLSSVYPYNNTNRVHLDEFYNGGTSSDGTRGVDYGVTFSANAEGLCLNDTSVCTNTSRGDVGDPNSQREGLFWIDGLDMALSVADGFVNEVSFHYSNVSSFTYFGLFEGVNGTGNRMTADAIFLPFTPSACPGYGAQFCPFVKYTYAFEGVARSIQFSGRGNRISFDDVTFERAALATPAPEPAAWAMMILGFAGAGAMLRRRRVRVA